MKMRKSSIPFDDKLKWKEVAALSLANE